jgi:hypothetical protein
LNVDEQRERYAFINNNALQEEPPGSESSNVIARTFGRWSGLLQSHDVNITHSLNDNVL